MVDNNADLSHLHTMPKSATFFSDVERGQKYGEYRAPYQYGHRRALKTPVAGNPHGLIHIRYMGPPTTGHRSLIIRIIAYYFGDHSLKLQGSIGIVALHGLSGLYSDRIDTVPYILHTFDRVLRN